MLKSEPVTSGLIVGLVRLGNAGLGLLAVIVMTRALTVDDFGRYSYIAVIISIAAVPIGRGWGNLLLRSASSAHYSGDWGESRGLVHRGNQLSLLLAGVIGAAAIVWSYAAGWGGGQGTGFAIAAVTCVLLFDQFSALRMQMIRGMDRPILAQLPENFIRPTVMIAAIVILSSWSSAQISLEATLFALATASCVSMLAGVIVLKRVARPNALATEALYRDRQWVRSAAPMAASAFLVVLSTQLDILVLGALAPPEDVGAYRIAVQFATMSALAYTSLNVVALQRFAYLSSAGDKQALQQSAKMLARAAFLLTLGFALALVLVGDWVLPRVFGLAYGAAYWPMVILCAGQCVSAAAGMALGMLTMSHQESLALRIMVGAVVLNLVLCVTLIPDFGTVGAAWATLISVSVLNLVACLAVRRRLAIDTSVF